MDGGLDDLRVETMVSKARSSSAGEAGQSIEHYLQRLENIRGSGRDLVVGNCDYDPSRELGGVAEWEELEREAAVGVRGTLHENFAPCVQVMDQHTDNSQMPFTVVNGECGGRLLFLNNAHQGVLYTLGARY